jgi:DGQHR domain-containing protein
MPLFPDITQLRTSWTKFDSVQVIDVVTSVEEINLYKNKVKSIDEPILRSFLGVDSLSQPTPDYWIEIQNYPNQKRLFALLAAIFTHYQNIKDFAEYSTGDMKGVFLMKSGKQYTNLRSALVEAGAAQNSYRRKEEVPYDLTPLYEEGKVGQLFKKVLEQRLYKIGWDGENFYENCFDLNFYNVLSISQEQFQSWLEGEPLIERKLKYQLKQLESYTHIKAYKVKQWLKEWNDIDFAGEEMRRKPDGYFLMFKIDARLLKRLSDVHRRSAEMDRKQNDASVQRSLKQSRSQEIRHYIHGGFPWSTISEEQRISPEYKDLKMPGILPTAIIANILGPDAERGNHSLHEQDRIIIEESDSDFPTIRLPKSVFDENWKPSLKPIEIIDGQHRLWAFDETENLDGNYELPVIAYYNLDRAWQAYLFYTINIKPVKINTSLGYDLYPLLRTQRWLESSKDGLLFYRENRAQELVEALWTYKESPWRGRIKIIGEGSGNISQAAFVKALTSSFLKKSVDKTSRGMGGLFSDIIKKGTKYQVLNWNRTQQAAFLIIMWDLISEKFNEFILDEDKEAFEPEWAKKIRENEDEEDVITGEHPAFTSRNSFLSRDQGVRGISMFANDLFYSIALSPNWDFNELSWEEDLDDKTIQQESIDTAIIEFKKHPIYSLMLAFASEILKLDWRTTSADFSDNPSQRLNQMRYKGGSGYSEVWKDLVELFKISENEVLRKNALPLVEFVKN